MTALAGLAAASRLRRADGWRIRTARLDEAEAVALVEADAGRRFHGWPGFTRPAGARLGRFHASVADGRVYVAVDGDDRPIGFAEMDRLGPEPYLAELSVAMAHQGRGIGGHLLALAGDWARADGGGALLLSTRRDVPWNGPWYARHGFAEIPAADYALPHIVARRAAEAPFQDISLRMMMRKPPETP